MRSAINCFQIFRPLVHWVLPAAPYPLYPVRFLFVPKIPKSYHLHGLSGGVIGPFRFAACIWQLTRCALAKHELTYVSLGVAQAPTVCTLVLISSSLVIIVASHDLAHCLSKQFPRNKIFLLLVTLLIHFSGIYEPAVFSNWDPIFSHTCQILLTAISTASMPLLSVRFCCHRMEATKQIAEKSSPKATGYSSIGKSEIAAYSFTGLYYLMFFSW